MHEKTRKELWGYAKDESLTNEELIKEKYSGNRTASGYPASPDHTEKKTLWKLFLMALIQIYGHPIQKNPIIPNT